ncbi:Presequence translocated-associated motor subunit pam17 [Penicillium malachiteum]|nr:Presequence translocated-associated motor subunit pam17 [Penicillium malachiteum]
MSASVLGSRLAAPTIKAVTAPSRMVFNQSTLVNSTAFRPSPTAIERHVRPTSLLQRPDVRMQSTSATPKDDVKLDWNSFFKLRASRRRYSLASSVVSSLVSTTVGVQVLSSQDLESLGAQVMGLDPFVVLGMATAACGAAGWLVGPVVGNGLWGLVYRRFTPSVAIKEKEFFDRIRRFRVDPSTNSIANPVPDYYGEKIGSVQGYRQWLKDQRAYNRKRRNFIA